MLAEPLWPVKRRPPSREGLTRGLWARRRGASIAAQEVVYSSSPRDGEVKDIRAAFLALHIPAAYALTLSPRLGTAHALAVVLYGLKAGVTGDAAGVLGALGYVAGAEVLWRMTGAALYWEFGKYASVLIAAVALVTECWRRRSSRAYQGAGTAASRDPFSSPVPRGWSWRPMLYFALLLPAAIPTFAQLDWTRARGIASFNLSGPFALAVLSTYLWRRPAGRRELSRLLLAITAPILGIAFLAAYSTFTSPLTFSDDSNWVTSGGFGPNQVSSLLGFGALLGLVSGTLMRGPRTLQMIVFAMTVGFIAQGLLTFSRAWVPSVLAAALAFGAHLTGTPWALRRFLGWGAACALSVLVLLPGLSALTGERLLPRFTNPSTTGRIGRVQGEFRAFREHPLAGTGVGFSRLYLTGKPIAPHTEPTRMLAEHGAAGLVALVVLGSILVTGFRSAVPGAARGVTAVFGIWATFVMFHSAMRVVAVPFAVAASLMAWHLGATDSGTSDERRPVPHDPGGR